MAELLWDLLLLAELLWDLLLWDLLLWDLLWGLLLRDLLLLAELLWGLLLWHLLLWLVGLCVALLGDLLLGHRLRCGYRLAGLCGSRGLLEPVRGGLRELFVWRLLGDRRLELLAGAVLGRRFGSGETPDLCRGRCTREAGRRWSGRDALFWRLL